MFDKVDDYIKGCLIFAQYQFPGQADEDQIQEWAKEIVGDMVSEEIVEKWYY